MKDFETRGFVEHTHTHTHTHSYECLSLMEGGHVVLPSAKGGVWLDKQKTRGKL